MCVRLIVRVRIGSAGDKDDEDYASQQTLFNDLGVELLDNAFQDFNACIFACEQPAANAWAVELMVYESRVVSHI